LSKPSSSSRGVTFLYFPFKMALLGMGNPLLDISAEVDQALLDKYELKAGDAILAEDKHQPLFGEMAKMPNVQYIAGGATQNTIRVAQWMLQEAGATAYMGCIGGDANGEQLKTACAKDGVNALYMVDPKTPTGTCATLITGIERSLCTNLSAANNYKAEHCKEAANWKVVQNAKIVYSAGFFATVSPDAIKMASEEKAKDGGIYCMNLSAPFLMQVPPFKKVFTDTMANVDFLFGNETEAQTWAETEGWESTDLEFIATRLSLIPSAKAKPRTVVITNGANPTIVCVRGVCTKHAVVTLLKEELVDTNGAGDAYVGGFLAGLVKGLPLAECCRAGAYAASVIVRQSGCTFPDKPGFKW
jgi:adenosine kinase